jgi:hypothetical protein
MCQPDVKDSRCIVWRASGKEDVEAAALTTAGGIGKTPEFDGGVWDSESCGEASVNDHAALDKAFNQQPDKMKL